jgi:ADP-heptose:LPS heptosyltransferase
MEWEGDPPAARKRSHVGDDLLRLADAVAIAGDPSPDLPRRPGTALHAGAVTEIGRKLVCIHPGVGSAIRQWPARHFAALIDLLAASHDIDVVLIGGGDEIAIAEEVLAQVQRRDVVRSLVGEVRLRDLPGLLASADLFVGNNSGPKHLAAGLGVPTVGIHSGTVDAREWGPVGANAVAIRKNMICSPCYFSDARDCPRELACLTELPPFDVYEICRRFLAIDAVRG